MNYNYKTIIKTGTPDPQWDGFLSRVENGHHEQSTYWAKVKKHQGWDAIRIKVFKDSELLAGAQILSKRVPMIGSIGYISSGPCYIKEERQALEILARAINQLIKTKNIYYLAITPYVDDDDLSRILEKNGYTIKPEMVPPSTTTGTFDKMYPNHLLNWEMIKWSKENGFKYFDFVQVDPFVTDHLSLGHPATDELKSRRLYGPTLFKMGFGGKVVKFSGPWFRFQHPVIRYLYRYFGPSLLRMPFTQKLVSRLS